MDKLGSALKESLKKIAGSLFYDKSVIESLVKDIQRALLHADVNVKLVFDLSNKIKKRALEEKPDKGVDKRAFLVNLVYEELVNFLGGEKETISLKKKPTKIMLVGLFGNGKTTTAGKLANYYSKRGKKVVLVGLDVHRPAAMKQLKQLGDSINTNVFIDLEEKKDPLKIWKKFESELNQYDVVIFDTSGRDALSEDLVREIEDLNKGLKPDENLLVISADLGQTAEKQAKQFHESCGITGVVVTRMDGTAKAGGALSACSATGAKVKFIGVGERTTDIEEFNPKGFVSRMLGMGDLEALLEKAKVAISEEKAVDLQDKFMSGNFDLRDMYEQMKAMKKMGPLSKVMEMIPGMGKIKLPKELVNVQEEKMKKWKNVIDSMTPKERENPDIVFDRSRIERIAKGSGTTAKDVRDLLKQYRQIKKVMKKFGGKSPEKLMKKFKLPV